MICTQSEINSFHLRSPYIINPYPQLAATNMRSDGPRWETNANRNELSGAMSTSSNESKGTTDDKIGKMMGKGQE